MLIDGLLVATGFTGALTLVWLIRRVVSLFAVGPAVAAHFEPHAEQALTAEIAKARREVLLLGSPDPAVAVALAEAKSRKVVLDVLLAPDADQSPFAEQGLQPRPASRATPAGTLIVVDDRAVIFACDSQIVVATGHPDLVRTCRQQFADYHPVSQIAAPLVLQSLPASTQSTDPPPAPVLSSSPVDDLLAAVARGNVAPDEEEEESAPPMTRATAELLTRLRKESSGKDDVAEKAA